MVYMRDSATNTTVERVLQHVRAALLDIEKSYRAQGRSVAELGAEQLAERMVAAVPLPSPVNERIGPFYRGEQVAKLLHISRQAVHERAKTGSLLALRTADDFWVYPTFQFKGRGVIPRLQEVLAEFRQAQPDRWAIAAWLVSHAQQYRLSYVTYAGYRWTAADGTKGWAPSDSPSPPGSIQLG